MLITDRFRTVAVSLGFVAWLATTPTRPDGSSIVGIALKTVFPDSVMTGNGGTADAV